MWSRKEIKQAARKTFHRNYWRSIFVCFIITILIGSVYRYNVFSFSSFSTRFITEDIFGENHSQLPNSAVLGEFMKHFDIGPKINLPKDVQDPLAFCFNTFTASGSYIFSVLHAGYNIIILHNWDMALVLVLLALLSTLYYFLVIQPAKVNEARFFIENTSYPKTSGDRVFFTYRVGKTWNVIYNMFIQKILCLLWGLTIVGFFVKRYSYFMVPYILAENPSLSHKEVFALSKKMMDGNKWRMFAMDLSFIGWVVLGFITFNLSNFFYFNAYRSAVYAQFYLKIRESSYDEVKMSLCDTNLGLDVKGTTYPDKNYFLKEKKERKWLRMQIKKDYSLVILVLLFFTFSICGFIWEVLFTFLSTGVLVNRGTLFGPWLPIYGSGCVALLVLLKKYFDKPAVTFSLAILVCSVLEYFTSLILEVLFHTRWWDYSGYFLNLDGRICFEGILAFSLGGCVIIYVIAPMLAKFYSRFSLKFCKFLAISLTIIFVIDVVLSFILLSK